MKIAIEQNESPSYFNTNMIYVTKRTIWNRRRKYSYLTQFKN